MDSAHDSSYRTEDGKLRVDAANQAVRGLIALVHPLLACRGEQAREKIEKRILAPSCGSLVFQTRKVDSLCSACSAVLARVAEVVVAAVAEYLSAGDQECAVLSLADHLEDIGTVIEEAYEKSRMHAFLISLEEELFGERF
jgi:hypothetical protein